MGYKKLTFAASAPLMNAVSVGIASTYSSTATEGMKSSYLHPNDDQVSWIGSLLPLSAILGGIVAGYFSDKIGRKGVMMALSVLQLAGWLLITYATSLEYVYAGRALTGICCGLICVVTPMYIVEIAIPKLRGNLGCRFQLYICGGVILMALLGKFFSWRWVAAASAIFSVFAPFTMLFLPESPQWLFMKGKQEEAVMAMRFFYGKSSEETAILFHEGQTSDSKQKFTMKDIIKPAIYKPALLAIALLFFQQFSGSNAILYYTVSIFKESSSSIDPTNANAFVALFMFLFTLLSTFLMDKLGRKILLFISVLVMCIVLNIFSTFLYLSRNNPALKSSYGWLPLLCLIVYISAFSLGMGPIPWLMMSEMSPNYARGVICGLGTACSWTFVFIITKTFIYLEKSIQAYGAYWLYSSFCFLCCVFTIFLLPETKGKTNEEIQLGFAGPETPMRRLEEDRDVSINNSES
ncbi:facilitated trehalose transporter Tret1-like [Uloborus diversus]|uniref:facilitated trehalose transporter Tret1-like n=1 Tax=Uloborus diversus TaxID=327109 RepID=UPI002409E454|nr:facilitated trehalose transporter Tret1-like [Uloborus diversus]